MAYQPLLSSPKLVWAHFQDKPSFAIDLSNAFLNNKCFFLPIDDSYLLAFLNSACGWFQLSSIARVKRGGYLEAEAQYVQMLSLPEPDNATRVWLAELAAACTAKSHHRLESQFGVRHRILADLAPPGRARLSRKLDEWWELDFAAFRDEVKRVFRAEISVKERGDWEAYLAEQGAKVRTLTVEIEGIEREIDAIVYRLFDLTSEEIALLEASIWGSY